MLTPRLPLTTTVLVIASAACAAAGVSQEAPPGGANAAAMPAIEFYLAKGEADACGPGCNMWIAAEGKFDAGATARLRRLLAKLGRPRPPIYFHSPGGLVTGALEVGRLIREQRLEVSVAHTVALGCDQDKPAEKSCEARKRSGEAIEARFDPLVSMCNSACVYTLAGGAVRHVPPWVKLAIHDVGLDPAAAPPRAAVREAKAVTHERIEEYLREMGIDDGLFKAALAIPFESKRFLERDEVVRFGLDRKEFDEAPWQFVEKPQPLLIKRYFARTDHDRVRYIDGLVTLACGAGQSFRLGLTREHAAVEIPLGLRSTSIGVNGRRFDLDGPSLSAGLDVHAVWLAKGLLDAIDDSAALELSAADLARNEQASGLTLSMRGFAAAYTKLRTSCDASVRMANAWLLEASGPSPKPAPPTDALSLGRLSLPAVPGGLSLKPAPTPPPVAAPTPPPSTNAVTTPPQSESAPPGCSLRIADRPEHLKGRVTAFLSAEEASIRTQRVETRLEAKISPAYASLNRVMVERYPQRDGSTMAAVPENLTVKVGDLVELNTRYRDQSLPCHFVPWTISRQLIDSDESHTLGNVP